MSLPAFNRILTIPELVGALRADAQCRVRPPDPAGLLPAALPADARTFYTLTDGAVLFEGQPYSLELVPRRNLVPTNQYLFAAADGSWEEPSGEASNHWYLVARAEALGQYISLDLSSERRGRCYDSFHETHALQGDSAVVALTFSDLLNQLYHSQGQYWYWLDSAFRPLGDAYDPL